MFRSDIVIDWNSSPRVITVLAPSTSVAMQDLYDTLRTLESYPENIDNDFIVSGSGKESLGSGVFVGLTVTLNNGQLAFEGRSGPSFVQCKADGGNLVAVDANGAEISSIYTTPYTQVILTSSSSATLQELDAIQYSSYSDGVWIDSSVGVAGTEYPAGTPFYPVSNLTDAVTIAVAKGFTKLNFLRDFTFNTGTYISNYELIGQGYNSTTFTFKPAALTLYCKAKDVKITGETFGIIEYNNCLIKNMNGSNIAPSNREITVNKCLIDGSILLPIQYSGKLRVLDSWAADIRQNAPRFDMGNCPASLIVRNYSGGLEIHNMTDSSSSVTLDINTGRIVLDDSVTTGDIRIRGIGILENNSAVIPDTDGFINKELITKGSWNSVYIDTINGGAGTSFPLGTAAFPVNNVTDALTIAQNESIYNFSIDGSVTCICPGTVENIILSGFSSTTSDEVYVNNHVFNNVVFNKLYISGDASYMDVEFNECFIENAGNMSGELNHCSMKNNISIEPGNRLSGTNLVLEGDFTTIDFQNTSGTTFSFDIDSGYALFKNMVPGCLLEVNMRGGEIELDSTCTGGDFYAEGYGTLYDESNVLSLMTVKANHLLALETIPEPIWATDITTITDASSAGYSLWNTPKKVLSKVLPFLFAK